jgi:hypothetical protein
MMATQELTIDKEFQALCPALTPEEQNLLEASLDAEGCREPILTWANHDDTVVDGHNRYAYCSRYKIPFKTKALTFASREEVINWIISNQLGRRNLSEEQKAYLRGKRYHTQKKADFQKGNQHTGALGHNDPKQRTSERLAEEYGVSEKTIRRDADFAEAIDTIVETVGPEAKAAILSGKTGATKTDVVKLAATPAATQKAAIAGGKEAIKAAVSAAKPTNGKEAEQHSEDDTKPEPSPKRNGKPPVGVILANEALNVLMRIPKDDPLRKRGFQIVTDWIRANQ